VTEPAAPAPADPAGRAAILWTLTRVTLAVSALLIAYFVAPLDSRSGAAVRVVAIVAGLVVFGAIFVRQVRQIRRARHPMLRAIEAAALVATLFVVVMASIHFGLARATPSSYSEALDRLDALYFTVTTLATVGFGDITPTSGVTRAVTTVQMVLGVILLGAGLRLLVGIARMIVDERRSGAQ
jgi:hypothetical protein